ncbi:MAG: 2OG-Fe(II) oxygenase [Burkholderiales bacterium]
MSAAAEAARAAESIAADIASRGYSVAQQFLQRPHLRALRTECLRLHAAGGFRPAGVGKSAQRLPQIRADEIAWLDTGRSAPAVTAATRRFEGLRVALNRALCLGLFEFECHFAHYSPGAAYWRHRDQFPGDSSRRLSCVLYLNDAWAAVDGGALRIHLDPPERNVDILPQGGVLVCFLSERFEHEVLPAGRDRWSVAGWFRTR